MILRIFTQSASFLSGVNTCGKIPRQQLLPACENGFAQQYLFNRSFSSRPTPATAALSSSIRSTTARSASGIHEGPAEANPVLTVGENHDVWERFAILLCVVK